MTEPHQFIDAYCKAVRDADVEAYTNLYDKDIRIFDLWDDWSSSGLEACRAMAKDWFTSLGSEHVIVTFSAVQVVTSGELAFLTGFIRFAAHAADGRQLRFLDERITVTMRKNVGAEWKVIHQHTSTPIGSSDMKVKMVR